MNAAFIDTSFWFALLNERDDDHRRASALWKSAPRKFSGFLTAAPNVQETVALLTKRTGRHLALQFLDLLTQSPSVDVAQVDETLFDDGIRLFRQRDDKDWDLVDCICFQLMDSRGLRVALATDHHFSQAGFQLPLREPENI